MASIGVYEQFQSRVRRLIANPVDRLENLLIECVLAYNCDNMERGSRILRIVERGLQRGYVKKYIEGSVSDKHRYDDLAFRIKMLQTNSHAFREPLYSRKRTMTDLLESYGVTERDIERRLFDPLAEIENRFVDGMRALISGKTRIGHKILDRVEQEIMMDHVVTYVEGSNLDTSRWTTLTDGITRARRTYPKNQKRLS